MPTCWRFRAAFSARPAPIYKVNGKEARAKDVQILFADAATGARSQALVQQGQIGQLINAKPQERRRILEDAAGIAGLYSRRHEAEMRLKAAEANLERLKDVIGQLGSQLSNLRRQARQAQKYKELTTELRKLEAIQHYQHYSTANAAVQSEEAQLVDSLRAVGQLTQAEAAALARAGRECRFAAAAPRGGGNPRGRAAPHPGGARHARPRGEARG